MLTDQEHGDHRNGIITKESVYFISDTSSSLEQDKQRRFHKEFILSIQVNKFLSGQSKNNLCYCTGVSNWSVFIQLYCTKSIPI